MAKTPEEPKTPAEYDAAYWTLLQDNAPNPLSPELQARITYLWNRGYDK